MGNVIIVCLIVLLVLNGIRSSIKHFKGEGDCCGGGGDAVKPKRKKLASVTATRTVIIEGMTCEHCRNRVENSINAIEGATAKVNLKKKTAVVSMEKEVSDEQIREVIEKAGYKVVSIR